MKPYTVTQVMKVGTKFHVWINGAPLRHPHTCQPAEFSTKRNAQRAAQMAVERERKGFLI